ncbi:hypothetical protein CDV31_000868 [Fusarium ambrosium]|uniref:Uncharacterized protein n=1 Tax=Fusarium ambrosium TaxID=131363 RepID=A0A428V1E5_9HYPO|nr:hypothetical protein CDV31_000868 [Fusarium ambrosium]
MACNQRALSTPTVQRRTGERERESDEDAIPTFAHKASSIRGPSSGASLLEMREEEGKGPRYKPPPKVARRLVQVSGLASRDTPQTTDRTDTTHTHGGETLYGRYKLDVSGTLPWRTGPRSLDQTEGTHAGPSLAPDGRWRMAMAHTLLGYAQGSKGLRGWSTTTRECRPYSNDERLHARGAEEGDEAKML